MMNIRYHGHGRRILLALLLAMVCAPLGGQASAAGLSRPAPWAQSPSIRHSGGPATRVSSAAADASALQSAAGLVIQPTSGTVGQTVTLTGTGFLSGEFVAVYLDTPNGMSLYAANAFPDGSFVIPSNVYWQAVNGPHTLVAVGQTSGSTASAIFTLKALIVSQPPDGSVGTIISVKGYGFGAREAVRVYWDAPVTLLVSTTSTLIGQIGGVNGLSVTVPASAARGWHIMTAVGLTTRAVTRSRFYVL